MTNNPLVSIIITNYNYGQFLEQAIESALNQTYSNIEVIVIDDKSTDNSEEILQKYAKKDKRLRFYKNDKRLGATGAAQKGVEIANGKFFTFLAADDFYEPDFIECSVKEMLLHP
ncbi:MAG: glycosyltransferase, partial [Candidatus Desulfofervidus auxilii]|nr:glycosyltransferase [Candidatus Desulfofervidus auxilii]